MTACYALLSALHNWNECRLTEVSNPFPRCLINTITFIGYVTILPLNIVELALRIIFDGLSSLLHCEGSLNETRLSLKTFFINCTLIHELFKSGVSRIPNLH